MAKKAKAKKAKASEAPGRGGPRPGAGRPRKWGAKLGERTQVNSYVPAKLAAALDKEAAANGMSRSEQLIRILAERYAIAVD